MSPVRAHLSTACLIAGLLAGASCTTTRVVQPAGLDTYEIVRNEALRAWRLVLDDHTLGYVVLFGDPLDPERSERVSYSVRNAYQQELGSIDGLGRAWRFMPHGSEALWTGSGTVLDGARSILEAPASSTLEEVPLEAIGGHAPSRP